MARRTTKNGTARVSDENVNIDRSEASADTAPTHEEIAREAYALYLARGAQHGHDEENWLDAERSLRARRAAATQPDEPASNSEQPAEQPADAGDTRGTREAPAVVPPEPAVFGMGSGT